MMSFKKVLVSWQWPSGEVDSMRVPAPLVTDIAVLMSRDVRCSFVRFEGLHYDDYVRVYGGIVLHLTRERVS